MNTRAWMTQFFAVLLLMAVTWAFLNTPDERVWQIAISAVLAFTALILAGTLIGLNFAGPRWGPARLPLMLACIGLLVALLWAIGQLDEKTWSMATWLGSALTVKRKKPVTPQAVWRTLQWALFFIRWFVVPLIVVPIAVRAAGAAPIRFSRLVLLWISLFVLGAFVPHLIVHHVPKMSNFWPQVLSAFGRFLLAYQIMVTAWVILGRAARRASLT